MNLAWIVLAGVTTGTLPGAEQMRTSLFHYPSEAGEVAPVGEASTWEGPGKVQIKFSFTYRDRRDAALVLVELRLAGLSRLIDAASAARPGVERRLAGSNLEAFAQEPIVEIEANLLEAVKWEGKRLRMLHRATQNAKKKEQTIPDLPLTLLEDAMVLEKTGKQGERAKLQAQGYRNVALGYARFLADDLVGAMKKMEAATQALPSVALPHVLMGSFYFLARGQEPALTEWRLALEIDPTNTELQAIIDELTKSEEGEE